MERAELLKQTVSIVSAYLSNNDVPSEEIPKLLTAVFEQLSALDEPQPRAAELLSPAVPVGLSVTDEYIVCLEDGKKLKMLKRYLRTHFDLSPEEYRAKWGLPPDYPMVAPNYAALRSDRAKSIGLGRKRR
jgi:predicted transcriptional regulator